MLSLSAIKRFIFPLVVIICLAGIPKPAQAQNNFSSGSTGADGAFSPIAHQTVQVPDSGVFNYTTVSIPAGVTITYARNARNTPVTILATGQLAFSGHAYKEMAKDNLTEVDVRNVLRGGTFEFSELVNDSYRYRISTRTIGVVVVFRSETHAVVVTAWRKR